MLDVPKIACRHRDRTSAYVNLEAYEVSGACAKLIGCFSEPSLDDHVLAIDPAKLSHRQPERVCRDRLRQLLWAWNWTNAKNSHANHLL